MQSKGPGATPDLSVESQVLAVSYRWVTHHVAFGVCCSLSIVSWGKVLAPFYSCAATSSVWMGRILFVHFSVGDIGLCPLGGMLVHLAWGVGSDHLLCWVPHLERCQQGTLPHGPVLGHCGISMTHISVVNFKLVPLNFPAPPSFLRSTSNLHVWVMRGS